MIKLLKMLIKL